MLPRFTTLIIIILALTAGVAGAFAGERPRAAQAAAGDLVFARVVDGDSEIFRRDAAGKVHQLTNNSASDELPRISPDGKLIAFSSDRAGSLDLYVAAVDGTKVRRLTTGRGAESYPAFSADGKRLAFSGSTDRREAEIYVINLDGSGLQRLTRTKKTVIDIQPSFSPDGKSLVFASNRVGYGNFEIYRLELEDTRLVRLTFNGRGRPGDPGDELMPEYSPDGKRIAYVSDISGSHQAWTMSPNGHRGHPEDVVRVTRHKRADVLFPRFSADGKQLVYGTASLDGGTMRLYTAAADGSSPTEIGLGEAADW